MATQGLSFYLWIILVIGEVLVSLGLVVDVVDLGVDLDLLVIDVCLRKPSDGELIVHDHRADDKVLEEDTAPTFDANIATGVADASALPVERAVIVLHPYRRVVAVLVDIVRAEIAVSVWIPMPSVGSDNRRDRLSHRCSRIVPSDVGFVVDVVDVVVDVDVVDVVVHVDVVDVFNVSHFDVKG